MIEKQLGCRRQCFVLAHAELAMGPCILQHHLMDGYHNVESRIARNPESAMLVWYAELFGKSEIELDSSGKSVVQYFRRVPRTTLCESITWRLPFDI
jgi:hypothetical protein